MTRTRPAGPLGMLEADLDAAAVQLSQYGQKWLTYHTHDSRKSPAGFPDRVFVRGDWLLFRELKRHGLNPTPLQAEWLDALAAVRHISVGVWRPADLLDGTIARELARR